MLHDNPNPVNPQNAWVLGHFSVKHNMEISRYWRNQQARYGLVGGVCPHCGEKMFPDRVVCPKCVEGLVVLATTRSILLEMGKPQLVDKVGSV